MGYNLIAPNKRKISRRSHFLTNESSIYNLSHLSASCPPMQHRYWAITVRFLASIVFPFGYSLVFHLSLFRTVFLFISSFCVCYGCWNRQSVSWPGDRSRFSGDGSLRHPAASLCQLSPTETSVHPPPSSHLRLTASLTCLWSSYLVTRLSYRNLPTLF